MCDCSRVAILNHVIECFHSVIHIPKLNRAFNVFLLWFYYFTRLSFYYDDMNQEDLFCGVAAIYMSVFIQGQNNLFFERICKLFQMNIAVSFAIDIVYR